MTVTSLSLYWVRNLKMRLYIDELLRVAIGWARLKLKQQSGQGPKLDTGKIRTKIQSVEAKIDRIK